VDTTDDVSDPITTSFIGDIAGISLLNGSPISQLQSPIQLCVSTGGSNNANYSYSYYGNFNANDTVQFDVSPNNYVPHYQLQVLY
jgi:hypothetical protein